MQPPIQKIANNHQPETMTIKTPCQSYAVVGTTSYTALHATESSTRGAVGRANDFLPGKRVRELSYTLIIR
jgi:hypothetical protein